ncbi:carbon-nitrogen hydrolase [Ahniella affigens]|uniref:Carbon-nitrogen hydrolase n=1 Tax=Ahniella affigens TaxID=2021234 RepID=A0A2P1PV00_9GAMM|nr:carbon-nitrogen hydrolase family protein [Ahniella affigens]AVP98676.1 carbon-nitrogen hydrolase [Ahniella affigens]
MSDTQLTVAIAQIEPFWLKRDATVNKVAQWVRDAGDRGARLVCFAEAIVPGYPFWLEHTDGARFESAEQQRWHTHYLREAVVIERGDLDPIRAAALESGCHVVLGVIERAQDRAGHSVYCSMVTIDQFGHIVNVHRKLMPTHEERLVWAQGDGYGLRALPLPPFTLGALNCWENWMPLARAALYAQGVNLHVATWPGSLRNTEQITRFVAFESRSYVLSASSILNRDHLPDDLPLRERLHAALPAHPANGGSAIAGPNGQWVVEPVVDREALLVATLDLDAVYAERRLFDPFGHYSRPDVLELHVRRHRPTGIRILDEQDPSDS